MSLCTLLPVNVLPVTTAKLPVAVTPSTQALPVYTLSESEVVLKNIRISPQKLNLVAQMIRKQTASKAISILQFSKRRISNDVEKALRSAIANAENNHSLDIDKLIVKEAYVGKGLVMKRFHARARGRGAKIIKPFSHLTILLSEQEGK